MRVTVFEGIDGKGRLSITLSLVILLINLLSSKNFIKSLYVRESILKLWFFWFLYASINSYFQFNKEASSFFTFIGISLFVPFVVMSVIVNIPKIEINRFLQYMQYIVYISFLILFSFARKIDGRLNVELFDPNEIGLLMNFLVAIISVRFIRSDINLLNLTLLMILPSFYIIFSGSRMAFGSFIILIVGIFFSFNERIGLKLVLKYLFILLILSLLIPFVLENTVLGERLLGTAEQTDLLLDDPAQGTIFEHFGDRGVYYVLGWRLFLKHFIWGIGLRNFIEFYPTVNHVEYMMQLAELGIVGFVLYLSFNSMILINLLKKRRIVHYQKATYTYLVFVFGSILFSGSVLYLYSSIAIAALYGLLILFIKA